MKTKYPKFVIVWCRRADRVLFEELGFQKIASSRTEVELVSLFSKKLVRELDLLSAHGIDFTARKV